MRIIFISTWEHEKTNSKLFLGCNREASGCAFDNLVEALKHQSLFKEAQNEKPTGVLLTVADDLEK